MLSIIRNNKLIHLEKKCCGCDSVENCCGDNEKSCGDSGEDRRVLMAVTSII